MTLVDADNTQTSRRRLLESGKALFARFGFEQTSTAIIAREAGTSESQLVRYYKGKAGLLEAIFNDCWAALNQHVQGVVVAATDAREALAGVLETVTEAFGRDADLAYLLLFEGRRIRGGSSEIVSDEAIASALLGATEAMIRDRLVAQRAGKPSPYTDQEIRAIFFALLIGLRHEAPTPINAS